MNHTYEDGFEERMKEDFKKEFNWLHGAETTLGTIINLDKISDFLIPKLTEEVERREKEMKEFILPKAQKFVDKVESGRARSKETYADMKSVVEYLSPKDKEQGK